MQARLPADAELFDDFGSGADEGVDDFGRCLTTNGRAQGQHAIGVLGRYGVYRYIAYTSGW